MDKRRDSTSRRCSFKVRQTFLILLFTVAASTVLLYNDTRLPMVHSTHRTDYSFPWSLSETLFDEFWTRNDTHALDFRNGNPNYKSPKGAYEEDAENDYSYSYQTSGSAHVDANEVPRSDVEKADQMRRILTVSDDPKWLPLDRNSAGIFVYAAYYDDVESVPFVRILMSLTGTASFPIRCLYFTPDNIYFPVGVTKGLLSQFDKKGGNGYHGVFTRCRLFTPHHKPYAVAVIKTSDVFVDDVIEHGTDVIAYNNDVTTILQVHYGERRDARAGDDVRHRGRLGVGSRSVPKWNVNKCFPSLHGYSNTMQLIQQVEISRTLGVDHFTFYNWSTKSALVNTVLNYYKKTNVADVLDWTHPEPMRSSAYFSQYEAIQDCLFRSLRSARYVLFGDLDEIIVPRSVPNVHTLLRQLFSRQPECGAFLFLNAFFENNPTSRLPTFINSAFAKKYGLNMLLTHDRVNEVWLNGRRAKPAVIPARVEEGIVHEIKRFRGSFKECKVALSQGLLHHYRLKFPKVLGPAHRGASRGYVSDHHLLALSARIVSRVHNVLRRLNLLHVLKRSA